MKHLKLTSKALPRTAQGGLFGKWCGPSGGILGKTLEKLGLCDDNYNGD
ncbi:MAG: hypothetical protein HY706_18195 [Candidatus Hydrogenedentes bacterium]|nr:hypothetical protein [Candidatus Hydrogenedentota bacterium]